MDVSDTQVATPPAEARTDPARRFVLHALAAAIYVAGGLLFTVRLWSDPRHSTVSGGWGDVGLFIWFLDNTQEAIFAGESPFFSDYLNAPYGVNALANTSLVLPGVLLAPVTALAGPILTFNLLVLAGPTLSAMSTYLVLGRYVVHWWPRLLGGLVFGFSLPIVMASQGHLQLSLAALVPLIVAAFVGCVVDVTRPIRAGIVLALLSLAQLLTGAELLALTAVACGVLLVAICFVARDHIGMSWRPAAKALGTATATFLVLAAYPIYFQIRGPQSYVGQIHATDFYKNDLLSLVVPSPYLAIADHDYAAFAARFGANFTEVTGYLGVPLLLGAVSVIFLRWRDPIIRAAGVTASVLAVFSLGARLRFDGRDTMIPLPWRLGDNIPLLENLLANRFALMTVLFVVAVCAVGLDYFISAGGPGRVLALCIAVLTVVSLVPRPLEPVRPVSVPVALTENRLGLASGSTVLVLPLPGPASSDAMLWQALAEPRFGLVGGYFLGPSDPEGAEGSRTPQFGGPATALSTTVDEIARTGAPPIMSAQLRRVLLGDLERLSVDSIVVGPHPNSHAFVDFVTDLLGRGPDEQGDGAVAWTASRDGITQSR